MRLYKWIIFLPLLCLCACAPQTRDAALDIVETEAAVTDTPIETPVVTEVSVEAFPLSIEDTPDTTKVADTEEEAPPAAAYRNLPPNEIGNIMIIMYHGLSEKENSGYDRKTVDFINDLNFLYEHGYRLLALNDLMDGRITTPFGYTPVVLTFDDGKSSTFSMVEQDGLNVPSPGCMVDIINNFCEEHPDFGKAATFYVMGRKEPFAGSGTLAERFAYLCDNGYEIGNHTWSHAELNGLNAAKIQEELGKVDQMIRDNCSWYEPRSLTYPYGLRPKESLRGYALEGEYEGRAYQYEWGIREGQSTVSANPFHTAFDRLNVPRVRGTDDSTPDYDVQDLGYFLRYYENHPESRYISDGDPQRLTVPESKQHLVNSDALGAMELAVLP